MLNSIDGSENHHIQEEIPTVVVDDRNNDNVDPAQDIDFFTNSNDLAS